MRLNPLYKEHIQMFVQVSLLSKCNRLEDEEISLVEFNSRAVSLLHFWWLCYISYCCIPRIKQFLLWLFKGIDWFGEFVACFEQHTGEFNASKLADFGAALTTADEPSLQEVLEELDVKSFFYTHM